MQISIRPEGREANEFYNYIYTIEYLELILNNNNNYNG